MVPENSTFKGKITMGGPFIHNIWKPDVYIFQTLRSRHVSMIDDNSNLWLRPGGHVYFSSQYEMTIGCPMNFKYYPFDTQICHMNIESCEYLLK